MVREGTAIGPGNPTYRQTELRNDLEFVGMEAAAERSGLKGVFSFCGSRIGPVSWRCLSLRGLGLPSDFRPSPRSG